MHQHRWCPIFGGPTPASLSQLTLSPHDSLLPQHPLNHLDYTCSNSFSRSRNLVSIFIDPTSYIVVVLYLPRASTGLYLDYTFEQLPGIYLWNLQPIGVSLQPQTSLGRSSNRFDHLDPIEVLPFTSY